MANKQQVASKIFKTANKMRSSIDAGDYKDFVLGFIFWRFLSEKELVELKKQGWPEDEIEKLDVDDVDTVEDMKNTIGYFIPYKHLYSTWIDPDVDFNIGDVHDAFNLFNGRNIGDSYQDLFKDIFVELSKNLDKLGSTPGERTKALSEILDLIVDIPFDDRQGYDALGFIYEYLLQNFAANAGKKAGEFYTPHEVSQLMSEIVSHELADQKSFSIYDPTSGSASLLLNIGKSIARRRGDPDSILYYAQEYKQTTYDLTRMNLIMKDINPANIETRCADTLGDDWPIDKNHPGQALRVDACVSNPPYSQTYDRKELDGDARFLEYGLPPKSKADYAFLLHNLYHLKPNGVMTIVLPHGVLFRGDSEGEIRKTLIEKRQIDAIIGLPPNIFFGTGIPTIIMVVKKHRNSDDILFIDASKGFVKEGKKNKLRARDIRKVFDAYVAREDVNGFAHVASIDEIRENGYNLNIPRYVDSSEPPEPWDIYASMFGGIPEQELDGLSQYWDAFPGLREELFEVDDGYAHLRIECIADAVKANKSIAKFKQDFDSALDGFAPYMKHALTDDVSKVKPNADEDVYAAEVFGRIETLPLVDPYTLYQALDAKWSDISMDVEAMQADGFIEAVRGIEEHIVEKTRKNKKVEVQDDKEPWLGRVLPFGLVQRVHFAPEMAALDEKRSRQARLEAEIETVFESLDEEDYNDPSVNEDNTGFVMGKVANSITELYAIESDEVGELVGYIKLLAKKPGVDALREYIKKHDGVNWHSMTAKKDGTYIQKVAKERIAAVCETFVPSEDSLLAKLLRVQEANEEIKELKNQVKEESLALETKTKDWIESVTETDAVELLHMKWVDELMVKFGEIPGDIASELTAKVEHLVAKYAVTYAEIGEQIANVQVELVAMLKNLNGCEKDMAGIAELTKLLGGE